MAKPTMGGKIQLQSRGEQRKSKVSSSINTDLQRKKGSSPPASPKQHMPLRDYLKVILVNEGKEPEKSSRRSTNTKIMPSPNVGHLKSKTVGVKKTSLQSQDQSSTLLGCQPVLNYDRSREMRDLEAKQAHCSGSAASPKTLYNNGSDVEKAHPKRELELAPDRSRQLPPKKIRPSEMEEEADDEPTSLALDIVKNKTNPTAATNVETEAMALDSLNSTTSLLPKVTNLTKMEEEPASLMPPVPSATRNSSSLVGTLGDTNRGTLLDRIRRLETTIFGISPPEGSTPGWLRLMTLEQHVGTWTTNQSHLFVERLERVEQIYGIQQ